MKITVAIAFAVGMVTAIVLIVHQGLPSILTLWAHAGFIILLLVPFHALPIFLDALGWRALLPRGARMGTLFWIATVREAINRLLPVANIGGEIVGIRLLTLSGVDGAVSAASVVVELLMTLVTQYLFVVLGFICLLQKTGTVAETSDVWLALGFGLPMLAVLVVIVRYGSLFERLARLAEKLLGGRQSLRFLERSAELDAAIRRLWQAPLKFVATILWQYASFVVGSTETWLALRWLGHPTSWGSAIALESLTQAVRNFIFFMPAGLGVQELGLVGLGHVLGLGSDVAIALSLAKRMREILFSVPALLSWYWTEARRGLRRINRRRVEI